MEQIFFLSRRHLVLNCEGDLHIFPFDSPMCTFAIESGEQICIFVFYANFWHSMSSWTSNLRISLRGCISSFLFPKCDIFHCKDVGNGGRCISSFIFCSCDNFLEFPSIFPRFNFPPTRAKSVFLALERRRRRRDKSNQLNRLLPRGEAGYESDFSLFTGCVAAPLDIYCNWVSYIVLQKISSVQVKDSFYFSLIHTEPDGLPLGGLQQVWRSKQLFS